jgi:hypothetical protein
VTSGWCGEKISRSWIKYRTIAQRGKIEIKNFQNKGIVMQRWIILASITILVGAVGCERRECDYVKSAKGDQICREDAEPEDDSEQAQSAEPGWGEERGAPK